MFLHRKKCFLNNSSASLAPSSDTTTDFALLLGLLIYPFSCSRFIVSQSNPFHALVPSLPFSVTRYRSSSVISSTLSLLYAMMPPHSHGHSIFTLKNAPLIVDRTVAHRSQPLKSNSNYLGKMTRNPLRVFISEKDRGEYIGAEYCLHDT